MEQQKRQKRPDAVAVVADTKELLRSQDSPLTRISRQWGQIKANFQVLLSPGDKQFKDLPKRVRLMLVSFGIPFLYSVTKLIVIPSTTSAVLWSLVGVVLAALTYGGMYWGVKGQVRKDSYFSVLPLPSLFVFANVMFLSTVFVGEINRLYLWGLFTGAIAMFMIFMYILALAVNVLNVTLFYTIPLSRLGETVAYISSVVTLFLVSYSVTDITIPLLVTESWVKLSVALIGFFVFVTILVGALWRYFLPYSRGFGAFLLSNAFAISLSHIVFGLTVSHTWIAGVMVSLVGYILFGFVIHKEQNTYKTPIIVEFWSIIMLMVLAALGM